MDSQHLRGRSEEEELVMRCCSLQVAAAVALMAAVAVHVENAAEASQPPTATLVYLSRESPRDPRVSLTEPVVAEYGWLGARFGVSELNTNGRFLGKRFELLKIIVSAQEDIRSRVRRVLNTHPALMVADLASADLLAVADLNEAKGSVIIDARTSDDALRGSQCRSSVFHVLPSWEMRANALTDFLVGKGWRRWLLLNGSTADDLAYTDALRRTARAAGAIIVSEASLPASDAASSLTQAQVDTRLESVTRTVSPYDVVLVTDFAGAVGERVMFNTAFSRLVAGTQGLRAIAWDPQFHDFAARGFEYRFVQFAAREMSERDYGNWLAVNVLGEAVLRGGVTEPAAVRAFLRSSRFSVAAFKGEPLNFRSTDQQLRQPILLFGSKVLLRLTPADTHGETAGAAGRSPCNLGAASTG